MGNAWSYEGEGKLGNQFLEVVKVKPVAEKIFSFLTPGDLKALSLVSWDILDAVRKSEDFKNRFQIHISGSSLENNLVQENNFVWKQVSLQLTPDIPDKIKEALEGILGKVESLHLYVSKRLKHAENLKCVEAVLMKTKSLKWLGMDAEILQLIRPLDCFHLDDEIQQVFRSLDTFEIFGHHSASSYNRFLAEENIRNGVTPSRENLFRISASSTPISFAVAAMGNQIPMNEMMIKFIPLVIKVNAGILEELHVHYKVCTWKGVEKVECPQLKRLKITADVTENPEEAKFLENFLARQPALEELEISTKGNFPLSIIQELITNDKVEKLKKFHLIGSGFHSFGQWSFLEEMNELRDFSFCHRDVEIEEGSQALFAVGEKILRMLPPTMQKISLRTSDFWEDLQIGNIGGLLARFQNLRELSLLWCTDAVTDEGFQSLISSCPNLTSLNLSHCSDLTDFGLTGVLPGGKLVGQMLDQFRGLQKLTIQDCEGITPGGLISVMKFQSLRSIQFSACPKLDDESSEHGNEIPEEFIFKLLRNNPSLECIRLSPISWEYNPFEIDSEGRRHLFEGKLRRDNSRLKVVELEEKPWWEDLAEDSDDNE